MSKYFRLLILVVLIGCTKTETLIPEPILPATTPPGEFTLSLTELRDVQATIEWTKPESGFTKNLEYDIAVNDSVLAFELTNLSYTIENLQADQEYSITVIVIDSLRNSSKQSIDIHTRKSFLQKVISFDLGYPDYSVFKKAIETHDEGLLIFGRGRAEIEYLNFFVKLDSTYAVEWKTEYVFESELEYMIESPENGYYVIVGKTIIKLNTFGEKIWQFSYPNDYVIGVLADLTLDVEGNILVCGSSDRNWGNDTLAIEYFVSKLSADGLETWSRFGGSTIKNSPSEIICTSDGHITISGTAESTGRILFSEIAYWKNSTWLLQLDSEGYFMDENIYPNDYNGGCGLGDQFLIDDGNNFLLFGTTAYNLYFSNSLPRFMNISNSGDVVWDNYFELGTGNSFPVLRGVDEMNNDNFLLLVNDYGGISISSIDRSGALITDAKLHDYPAGIMIKQDTNDDYVYLSSGQVIILNHDGYVSQNNLGIIME